MPFVDGNPDYIDAFSSIERIIDSQTGENSGITEESRRSCFLVRLGTAAIEIF